MLMFHLELCINSAQASKKTLTRPEGKIGDRLKGEAVEKGDIMKLNTS